MKRAFIIIAALLIVISCEKRYDRGLTEKIEAQCSQVSQGCIFNLADVTDFEWEKVYVFYGLVDKDEISAIIGFNCKCDDLQDQRTRLIYIFGGNIAHEFEYSTMGELLQFRSLRKADEFISYDRAKAKFYAIKKKGGMTEESYYDLFPVEGERAPQ